MEHKLADVACDATHPRFFLLPSCNKSMFLKQTPDVWPQLPSAAIFLFWTRGSTNACDLSGANPGSFQGDIAL